MISTQKEQILSRELSCPVRSGGPSRVKYVVTWRGAFPESVNISEADVTGITLHQGHSKGSSEKWQDSHLKCVLPASKKKHLIQFEDYNGELNLKYFYIYVKNIVVSSEQIICSHRQLQSNCYSYHMLIDRGLKTTENKITGCKCSNVGVSCRRLQLVSLLQKGRFA